ncbi:hypothetical protein HAZT_HAZT011423 [Hyalella azteca]|uniref:Uncharacterized protein n=1 Tax=Hyalella azteca TaxID=294128 RepID=A0A6A0GY78_HYAAZ|nr:hypothetical protein HAZT_HAZT011423 [Hyalella azteca]
MHNCIDFWDTAGQERFQTLHASYYHQAHAAILVFDGTRKVTYKNLATWYTELRQHRPEIPCLCAVNKIDGELSAGNRVDENGGLGGKTFGFPQQHGLPLYYVSAAAGTNVVKVRRGDCVCLRPRRRVYLICGRLGCACRRVGMWALGVCVSLCGVRVAVRCACRCVVCVSPCGVRVAVWCACRRVLFEDAIKAAYEYKINPTDLSDQIMEELELHPHQDPQDQDLHQDSDGDQNVGITTDKSGGVDATDSPAS